MAGRRVMVVSRVNISMVSLKWGDVLSAVLPGAVATFAVAPWFPPFWALIADINNTEWTTGVAFLFAAAIVGGIIEGITRITWEKWISGRCPLPKGILANLTPVNLPLYERSVDSSYKYVTFYANLAWAVLLMAITYMVKSPNAGFWSGVVLAAIITVLLRASFVQWTYFVNYQTQVFGGPNHAGQRSAAGDSGVLRDTPTKGLPDAGSVRNSDDTHEGRIS